MIFIYFSEVIFPIFPTIWEVQIVIPFIYEYLYDYDLQCNDETLMLLRFTLILVWVMFFHMIIQIFWDSEYSLSYDSPQFILTPIDKPQAQHM